MTEFEEFIESVKINKNWFDLIEEDFTCYTDKDNTAGTVSCEGGQLEEFGELDETNNNTSLTNTACYLNNRLDASWKMSINGRKVIEISTGGDFVEHVILINDDRALLLRKDLSTIPVKIKYLKTLQEFAIIRLKKRII